MNEDPTKPVREVLDEKIEIIEDGATGDVGKRILDRTSKNFRHEGIELVRDAKGFPILNIANATTLLKEHPDWQGVLGFNEYRSKRMVLRPLPGCTEGNRDLVDEDYIAAERWLNQNGFPKANSRIVIDATRKVASENKFNPLTDYLNGVKWDGEKRIDKWLVEYCGAEDTKYVREVGTRWMIAAVARAMKPGCKVDTMLVLEGSQGAKKSTAVRTLAGTEFYGDNLPDMTRKDAQEYVTGVWIIEVAELVAARRDQEAVKAFISRQRDEFRWAYGREIEVRPRQCIFVGTTNQDNYLRDETGNRRFWPVRVGKIDIGAIEQNRDHLWAEAVHRYHNGEQWWLPDDVEEIAQEEQSGRHDVDMWISDIAKYVENKSEVSPREVVVEAVGKVARECTRADSDRAVRCLKSLGFERDGVLHSGPSRGQARYVRSTK